MALALFPKRPLREAVVHVTGLGTDPIAADDGLSQLQRLSLVSQREGRYRMLPLTYEYALAELAAHPDFEQEARERWVRWYQEYAHKYGMGGTEWEEWHIQYDRLEEEWENILAVFNWCVAEERYENVIFLLEQVSSFANIYGHWDSYLRWIDWLIQAGERRGDWSRVFSQLVSKGSRFTFMGNNLKAQETLASALKLREYATPKEEVKLLLTLGRLCIRLGNLKKALEWFAQGQQTFGLTDPQDDKERRRDAIGLIYWQAVAHFEGQNYDQAERLFQQVLEQGQIISWQRAINYAQNYLADIAIVRGNLEEADRLLRAGLSVAERNKDKRRTAFYKRSFAYLEHKQRNLAEAQRWASAALDGFDRLGMQPEAEEMQELLQSLKPSQN